MRRMIDTKQEAWIEPTLLNGWSNSGGANATLKYYKDIFGVVRVEGVVKGGESSVLFVLPVGYRGYSNRYPIIANNDVEYLNITSTGAVILKTFDAANYYISISFREVS